MDGNSAVSGFLKRILGLLLLGPLLLQGSCDGSRSTLLIVEVSGHPAELLSLKVKPILDGKEARAVESFPGSQTRFGLQFSSEARGPLRVEIEGLQVSGCVGARGEGNVELSGQPQLELGVPLVSVVPPICNGQVVPTVSVSRSGDGSGSVSSSPRAIACGSNCTSTFAAGERVSLIAEPDPGSLFTGWSGGCTGTDRNECQLTVNGLVSVHATFGKPPTYGPPVWLKQYWANPPLGFVNAVDLAVDSGGNVVVAANYAGTAYFGSGPMPSGNLSTLFLIKYRADGTQLWSKSYGGTGSIFARTVAVDGAGDVYVAGSFSGSADFGGGDLASKGSSDVFVVKYRAADGTHVWSKRGGGTGQEGPAYVVPDGAGNVLLSGTFVDTADFGGTALASAGSSDLFVAKYRATDGSHVWSKGFGGTGMESGGMVGTDSGGDVYVTGQFQGSVDFGGGPLTATGSSDLFVARYTAASGNPVWAKRYGGSGLTAPSRLLLDTNGGVFLSGRFTESTQLGGAALVSAGGSDGFVARYRAVDGSHVWARRFGGSGYDQPAGLALDSGGLTMAGLFDATTDLGAGPVASAGKQDILLARYKPDGNLIGFRRFGGAFNDQAFSVAADGSGNVLVCGAFQGTVDFGGGPVAFMGDTDAFVLKIAPP